MVPRGAVVPHLDYHRRAAALATKLRHADSRIRQLQAALDELRAVEDSQRPANPHHYVRFNRHGTTCHYPECTLAYEQHPDAAKLG